jgi:hypothetical protein
MAKQKEIEEVESIELKINFDNKSGCVSIVGKPQSKITLDVNGEIKTVELNEQGTGLAYFKGAEDFIIKIV